MYLKQLELRGFKSFPERTTLNFDKPLTAIVGPNGSGKSNIADALQWVMGEQSTKALRGGKMEDVIFGGTEKRGQVGYAEVSLTLDNTDHRLAPELDEVQVTRRFYRSGDSEYFINKKAVRLRDINELFMDTGLGREGYSIIGQGKIDSILSARSTDRREIFEEAAGISRYRHRKEESERKLQRAEDDLLRVNDKISELELQVEPLRKQSEIAKKYLVLRDELRGLEVSLWLTDLEAIAERTRKLEQDALASAGEVERAKKALSDLYEAGEKFAERMRQKDVEAESLRESLSRTENRASEEESQAAVLRAEKRHNQESIDRVNEEIRREESQSSGLLAQIGERESRLSELDSEKNDIGVRMGELNALAAALFEGEGDFEEKLRSLTLAASDNGDRLSDARVEASSLAAALQEMAERAASLQTELAAQEERLNAASKEAADNEKELSKAQGSADSLRNVSRGYAMRAESLRKRAESLQDTRTKLEMALGATRSRRQMLADMEREYEGYSRAVKTLMRESSRGVLRGIHGPAGELIKTGDKYALAIETAMGAAMQNIIVSSEQDGKNAINLLKRLDAGRVTLLPMSVIRGSRIAERGLEAEEGFEGVAFDLVSFDGQYRDIFLNLLGRTVIADTMDSAIRIAGRFSHKFRIVTLDGQVINAGGSMTGGSISKNTGILSRANELKTLTEREKQEAEALEKAKGELEELRRGLEKAEYELKVASEELREAENSVLRLSSQKRHYDLLIESLHERLEELDREGASLRRREKETEGRRGSLNGSIVELEREAASLRERLDAESGGRELLMEKRRRIEDEQSALRERRASIEAQAEAENRAIGELKTLRKELRGGRESQSAALRELQEKKAAIEEETAAHDALSARFREEAESLRRKITAITQEKLAIEAERSKSDKLLQEKNNELLNLERVVSRIESRREATGMEEKQILDKLWDSYQLGRSQAMEQRMELASIPEARRRTGELRREIKALGPPNIGAIEEFERVNTRYTYLTEQRNDIESARRELLGIIGEITGSMETIFKEELERINEGFQQTFLELFGGGRAGISLEDPEDVLNSGIEIKVQPPGKTLKTITLLSGGEKAFVAIALYFAILKIRPTPFVVMDEIEAALDDANVIRVAEYMRKLTDKTQFLTITHRRGTMEEADVLYGVTMQEQGVSKVIAIDLDEAEKTIKAS